jgi:hypothetical protein
MLNERLGSTGWKFDKNRIKILDSRMAWKGGLFPALDSNEGKDVFKAFIEEVKPDLVVIDSLGSFVEEESNRESMKSMFDFLISTGDRYKCAHLLIHHLRKRKNNERNLPLDLSEVIGSSVIIRQSALVIGMEKRNASDSIQQGNHRNEIVVRHLKTWDKPFPSFSFVINSRTDDNGKEYLGLCFNQTPLFGEGKQDRVWSAILNNYSNGTEFQRSYIEHLCEGISSDYIKKLLSEWTNLGRLERFGNNRGTTYRLSAREGGSLPTNSQSSDTTESTPGTTQLPGEENSPRLYPECWDGVDEKKD